HPRDLPRALPVDDRRAILNSRGVPDFETCATDGRGVLDALKTITRLVIKDLRTKKVVPPSRSEAAARPSNIPAMSGPRAEMEDQINQQLEAANDSDEPAPAPAKRPEPSPVTSRLSLSPATALAPAALQDYARA
ncbi:MAG: GTP-binding protein, partial [Myxococcaceae bacterium]